MWADETRCNEPEMEELVLHTPVVLQLFFYAVDAAAAVEKKTQTFSLQMARLCDLVTLMDLLKLQFAVFPYIRFQSLLHFRHVLYFSGPEKMIPPPGETNLGHLKNRV